MDEMLIPVRQMAGRKPKPLHLDADEWQLLGEIIDSGYWASWQIRRAKVILGLADGARIKQLIEQIGYSRSSIQRTRRGYEQEGVAGLMTKRQRTGRPRTLRLTTRSSAPCAPTAKVQAWTEAIGA